MFFRREQPKTASFQQRLDSLKAAGFTVTPQGSTVRVSRGETAADLRDTPGGICIDNCSGILMGSEIGALVDGGFQKFFRTPSGVRKPATADQLKALHDFEDSLRDILGETGLYNEALGTVSTFYQYDRLQDRDRGVPKRVWD